jgi:hypothetical protein
MPNQLPFENVDFAGMARNINDPGKLAPLPQKRSTIAHDVMDLAKTGIETYGQIKKGQIDAKRQAEINTINAMTSAFKLAGLGMKVPPMAGLTQAQAEEVNRVAEKQREMTAEKQKNQQASVKKLVANPTTGMMDVFDTRTGETFASQIPITESAKPTKAPRVFPVKDMMGNTKLYIQDPDNPTNLIEANINKGGSDGADPLGIR